MMYHIAGNFKGSKFWRMTQILRFGEFNFGAKYCSRIAAIELQVLAIFFGACLTIRQIRQSFLPSKLPAIG